MIDGDDMSLIGGKNEFTASWVTVCRMFRVANKVIELHGEINEFELNSYNYIYEQCTDKQKKHLQESFCEVIKLFK